MEVKSTFFRGLLYRIEPSPQLLITDDFGNSVALDSDGLWKAFRFALG